MATYSRSDPKEIDHALVLKLLERSEAVERLKQLERRFLAADLRSLLDFDQRNTVHRAGGEHRVAFGRDVHLAHDVATGRNHPGLKVLRLGIEAHHRVRLGAGFANTKMASLEATMP